MDAPFGSGFLIAFAQIIGINILLSGDNAVVIALAARSLPARQQKKAIVFGSAAAILLRIVLTITAVALLTLPYLKIVGSLLLLWIGIQLLLPDGDDDEDRIRSGTTLFAAIRTILVADLVMSLDNVLGVAAAADGDLVLLISGLVVSIPLIVFGSTLILKVMDRFPVIITLGAMLLGYVAGEMLVTDPALAHWIGQQSLPFDIAVPTVGALIVFVVGKLLLPGVARRRQAAGSAHGRGKEERECSR